MFAQKLLALLLLIILSPILAIIVIGLLISDHRQSPLFLQERHGLNGKIFKCWKFRTMNSGLDDLSKNAYKNSPLFSDESSTRIFPFGKFLRRYCLDEIPQLVNILIGNMAFVGPRPLPRRDVEKFQKYWFHDRHFAKPGITGIWQTKFRGNPDISFGTIVIAELVYEQKRNFWSDLKICLATITKSNAI